jgi:HlyD family secretion protein
VRNATGTVQPVLSVHVGSFVSGPISELFVDFNQKVTEHMLLATIDPRIYKAAVARDSAALKNREAEVDRVKAQLQQAINDEERAKKLYEDNPDFISESELDVYHFNRKSLEAQVAVAETAVEQAQANLQNSEANLGYTEIKSPVDGIVIDRKIDPGQTLAAQFQTPELFIVAKDMDKEMHIFASVDEADIGLIQEAQRRGQTVQFTVDAYPDELFEGKIHQVRMSSTTTQNVVTYPVVVSAPNRDMKLMPGMTAELSFRVDETENVLRVPNPALRFFPQPEQVRPEDRKLLDGAEAASDEETGTSEVELSAAEKAEARAKRNRRHVWVAEGDLLRAVEVVTGISDHKHTEIVSGNVSEGMKLVTGIKPKK